MTDAAAARPSSRSRFGRVVVGVATAATVAALGVTAAASIDRAASLPERPATRLDPPTPAVMIGDSAIAALRWVPNASSAIVGFQHTLDLESCRRLASTSCGGREGRQPPNVREALQIHGDKYHTLIVATGYNDSSFDFAGAFVAIVDDARALGYDRIVWWSLRSDVDYVSPDSIGHHEIYAVNNATLSRLVERSDYPDVVMADWGAYSSDKVEWFATDGVHHRAVGAWAAADYLTRKMAHLDGRACPVPVGPFEEPLDPCPDPDVTGPVADIEALYPIGVDGLLCYQIGEERRFECRSDTHVLRLERELETGMVGPDVSALQIRLQRLGYYDEPVDQVFGDLTGAAVAAYQADSDLVVTGVGDIATLDALGFDVSAISS